MASMEDTIYATSKGKKVTNSSINEWTQFSLHISRFRDKEHILTCDQCCACESHVNSYEKSCKCKLFTLAFQGSLHLHFFYPSCIVFILHLHLYEASVSGFHIHLFTLCKKNLVCMSSINN
jgi:hypothetical protein